MTVITFVGLDTLDMDKNQQNVINNEAKHKSLHADLLMTNRSEIIL